MLEEKYECGQFIKYMEPIIEKPIEKAEDHIDKLDPVLTQNGPQLQPRSVDIDALFLVVSDLLTRIKILESKNGII